MKQKHYISNIIFLFLWLFGLLLFSCATKPNVADTLDILDTKEGNAVSDKAGAKPQRVQLLFAGDIMAHKPNFLMKDFSLIYKDIEKDLKESDFAFCNLEAPVAQSLDWQTYPTFNMKNAYPEACINAGFNVFSLANNHCNDQGLQGILQTQEFFSSQSQKTKQKARPIFYSGLKTNSKDKTTPAMTPIVIEKNGIKILFLAVTELLNSPNCSGMINYIKATKKARQEFAVFLKQARQENPCDIFVLSFHSAEKEYIADVTQEQQDFYKNLLDSGVDILFANHPHVIRQWQVFCQKETQDTKKLIMFGNGNTISAQRFAPDLDDATKNRADTGDGLILTVDVIKTVQQETSQISLDIKEPIYITTFIDENCNFVIKKLNSSTIQDIKQKGFAKWATYMQKRLEIDSKIKGKKQWL